MPAAIFRNGAGPGAPSSEMLTGEPSVPVNAGAVTRAATLQSVVTASGEIVATRYANIGSPVMGRLVSLSVKEGDRVSAGQVLGRIDAVQAAANVASVEAALEVVALPE